jgi:SWI/SNF-related matrix-associated actin-dependent regulator 1 of chromatin subfamily A
MFDSPCKRLISRESSASSSSNLDVGSPNKAVKLQLDHSPSHQQMKMPAVILIDHSSPEIQPDKSKKRRRIVRKGDRLSSGAPSFGSQQIFKSDTASPENLKSEPLKQESNQIAVDLKESSADEADTPDDDTDDQTFEEDAALFFNTSDRDSLSELTQMNQEQVKIILKLRPFSSYSDLQGKIQSSKGISQRILDNYRHTVISLKSMDRIISKCEKIGDEMEGIMNNWNDANDPVQKYLLKSQPGLISKSLTLKSYQLIGVSWLVLLHRKKLSGILADDMGLGKTAQVISFVAHLMELNKRGPHLVVCPSSTLNNWLREFDRWLPNQEGTVRAYQGSQAERYSLSMDMLRDKPIVVLTTYNVATGTKEDRKFLRKMKFESMILDEGHMVKSPGSQRVSYCHSL